MSVERSSFLPSKPIVIEGEGSKTNLFVASKLSGYRPEFTEGIFTANYPFWETYIATSANMDNPIQIAEISLNIPYTITQNKTLRTKLELTYPDDLDVIWDNIIDHPQDTTNLKDSISHGLAHASFEVNFLGKIYERNNKDNYNYIRPDFMHEDENGNLTLRYLPVVVRQQTPRLGYPASQVFGEITRDKFDFTIDTDEHGAAVSSVGKTHSAVMGKLYPLFPVEPNMV